MDKVPLRHLTQREHRRIRCPCRECGNLFYNCPFNIKYHLGVPLPVFNHACEEPVKYIQPNPGRIDPDDYIRVVTAYSRECHTGISGQTFGVSMAESARRLDNHFSSWYASPAIGKAVQRALSAYGHMERDPTSAIAGAEAALAISSICPDAYWLLARFRAKSYQEALDLYEQGYADYDKKLLSSEGRKKCAVSFGDRLADAPPYQGAVRCAVGAISVLCRMRRGGEAYERMQALLKLTPPLKEAPSADVWTLAPEVVYRALGPGACLAWLERHLCQDIFEAGGAAVWWVAMYALAWVATHLDEGFRWSTLDIWEDETRVGAPRGAAAPCCDVDKPRTAADKLRSGLALAVCCCWLPHLLDMLLGDMPLPPGPLPSMTVSPGSLGCQVAYARYCGDMWRDTPGVLDYVRRYRNTYEVFAIACDARINIAPSIKDLRRYLYPNLATTASPSAPSTASVGKELSAGSKGANGAGGSAGAVNGSGSSQQAACIFLEGIMYEGFFSWIGLLDVACIYTAQIGDQQDATMSAAQLEVLRLLLKAGCPINGSQQYCLARRLSVHHSPLLVAMSRGYGPDAVRELVKAGADPFMAEVALGVPLLSAAEEGMWRELQAVLKIDRKQGSKVVPLVYAGLYMTLVPRSPCGNLHMMTTGTVSEMALLVTFKSSCLPCVEGATKGCFRCSPEESSGQVASPHGPWCNFSKVVEVLVAYGMTTVSEWLMKLLHEIVASSSSAPVRAVRQNLLDTLKRLLREAAERQKPVPAAAQEGAGAADIGGQGKGQALGPDQTDQANAGSPAGQARAAQQGQAGQERNPGKGPLAQVLIGGGAAQLESVSPRKQQQGEDSGGRMELGAAATADRVPGKGREPEAGAPGGPRQGRNSPSGAPDAGHVDPTAAAVGNVCAEGRGTPGPPDASDSSGFEGGDSGDGPPGIEPAAVGGPSVVAAAAAAGAAAISGLQPELAPHHDRMHCWSCGREKDRAAGVKMRKCSLCATARYCGEACQREHWPSHRLQCKLLAGAKSKGQQT